jgi:hypothetical protein
LYTLAGTKSRFPRDVFALVIHRQREDEEC